MLKLKPLGQWYCDVCGQIIEKPEDGYVVWGRDEENRRLETGFKIIHQRRCDKGRLPSSSALSEFLGQDGLNKLLGMFLSNGPIRALVSRGPSEHSVADMDEFVDFFRRVQTRYYEEARCYFQKQELLDHFSDSNEIQPYQEDVLKRIAEEYSESI